MTDGEQKFFLRGRRYKVNVLLVGFCIFFMIACAGLEASGTIAPARWFILVYIPPLLQMAYSLWGLRRSRTCPINSFSSDGISWGSPFSLEQDTIPAGDIVGVQAISPEALVLLTRTQGALRIPLDGLTGEDYQALGELVDSRFERYEGIFSEMKHPK